MSIRIEGLEDLQGELDELGRRAEALDGEHTVSFETLFPPRFMRRHTSHPDIEAFIEASGFEVKGKEDFEAIPDEKWDEHVRNHSRFLSWEAMMEQAASNWVAGKLGL